MAALTWPDSCYPQGASIGLQRASLIDRSPFNGNAQIYGFNAERLMISLTLPQRRRVLGGELDALIQRISGGAERVNCWHFARPEPLGTMRGSPVTSATRNRGATTLPLTTDPSVTLRAGDCIGAGGQIFMVRDNETANGSGAMTVQLVNRVRATILSGSPVTWYRPTAEFVCLAQINPASYAPGRLDGAAIDLEEIWS